MPLSTNFEYSSKIEKTSRGNKHFTYSDCRSHNISAAHSL